MTLRYPLIEVESVELVESALESVYSTLLMILLTLVNNEVGPESSLYSPTDSTDSTIVYTDSTDSTTDSMDSKNPLHSPLFLQPPIKYLDLVRK